MKKAFAISVILTLFAGCNTDIVTTKQLKTIKNKCVYVTPIESQDPYVGKVIRDVLEKEFVRKHIQLCDADNANVILTGSTFMTTRSHGETSMLNLFGGKQSSAQAIESVTIAAKDKAGNLLLTASYNNVDQQTASKLAQDFGSTLADKFR
jgi:ethanolamine utilization protein EutA (predicted chaperonin)